MLKLNFNDKYNVLFFEKLDEEFYNNLNFFLAENNIQRIFLITDSNLNNLYKNTFSNLKNEIIKYIMPFGEVNKSLKEYEKIIDFLLSKNITKSDLLVSFGGGVVSDITSFIASTIKRGINYINIPTSLIAQVDASIGGKNSINILDYKNQIGTFYDPKLVLINKEFLSTLPEKELISGYGEILKIAILSDENLFNSINEITRDINLELIYKAVKFKSDYCNKTNEIRDILNFGHTFGHAIESIEKFKISHGLAVLNGIYFALNLAKHFDLINQKTINLINNKFNQLKISLNNYNLLDLYNYILLDKKEINQKKRFILISDFKKPIFLDLTPNEIYETFKEIKIK